LGCKPTKEGLDELMKALLKEILHNPLLWLLSFVPVVFIAAKAWP